VSVDGSGFLTDLAEGDVVSLHWEWVCDRLTPAQLQQLRYYTKHHLDIANAKLRQTDTGVTVE
jgi:hypothetical protein